MQTEFGVENTSTFCLQCPRRCSVDRSIGKGFCGEGEKLRISRAAAHHWEEPCISGTAGSGTVFFSGCNLRCVFCQNAAISRGDVGKELSVEELAAVFLRLEGTGVHNINLVTPTHFSLQILSALKRAALSVPVVWNSGGYESAEIIRQLNGAVDIYMPDFKYVSSALSAKYSSAADYFERAKEALDEMVFQCGGAEFDGDLMKRGVLVRHLVLPGCVDDSKAVLRFLHRRYGGAIYISIMRQYTPMSDKLPDCLSRAVSDDEYEEVCAYAEALGIENGFLQEKEAIGESFIPPFDLI